MILCNITSKFRGKKFNFVPYMVIDMTWNTPVLVAIQDPGISSYDIPSCLVTTNKIERFPFYILFTNPINSKHIAIAYFLIFWKIILPGAVSIRVANLTTVFVTPLTLSLNWPFYYYLKHFMGWTCPDNQSVPCISFNYYTLTINTAIWQDMRKVIHELFYHYFERKKGKYTGINRMVTLVIQKLSTFSAKKERKERQEWKYCQFQVNILLVLVNPMYAFSV